ncbi:MAG: VanZ family protein [Candidatus Marinimicrobia bacterium]|nr:VanZ family protein [Candidatus Neomarinimicrobiota bacterium]
MKKVRKVLYFWGPVVLWGTLIFYLSSLPSPPPSGNPFFDLIMPVLAHLVEYGLLFVFIHRASKKLFLSFLLAIFYAFSDEFHQSFVPTRTPSLFDILIDVLGMVLAWITIWKLLPKAPQRLNLWAKKLALI